MSMRFMILKDDLVVEEIEFLRDRYSVVSGTLDDEVIYEVDESLRGEMKVFERAGLIKEIKTDIKSIDSVRDIITLTNRVEILQGGSLYLRVYLLEHVLEFSEQDLLTSHIFMKYLLRLGKVMRVEKKDWYDLLQYWLDIGEHIIEPSQGDELVEKVLNYLSDCTIFTSRDLVNRPYTLYYQENEPDRVYCDVENLIERVGYDNRRKLRSLLSEYIVSNSMQFRIYNKRRRFWAFSIERCGIELDKQRYKREDQEDAQEDR